MSVSPCLTFSLSPKSVRSSCWFYFQDRITEVTLVICQMQIWGMGSMKPKETKM